MSIFVSAVGTLIFIIGISFLVSPSRLKNYFYPLIEKDWLYVATLLRVVIGIIFLFAAGSTRFPTFVMIVGVISILTGVIIPFFGTDRMRAFVRWWIERSNAVLRLWALVTSVFGIILIWAGV
jgi:DMSO reductase anchor subunit